jgi:oligopeptide transport system substrate-binding protein
VSNGAYILAESVVQSYIKIVRNPYYWDNENTTIDEVYYYPIEDQSSELKRYRAGEIDFTYELPNNQFKWIKANLNDELHILPYLGTYYYGFNLTKPPFKDSLNLRLALSMAIDRDIITSKVTQFGETPTYAFVPPGIGTYQPQNPDWASWTQEQRTQEAQRLYKLAGYSKTDPLDVELRYNTSENHKKIAIAMAAMWKQALGVKTHLINEEFKVFLANRKLKKVTQIFRAGWISDYNDPYSFLELMNSKHGLNDSAYNNPKYDSFLKQSSITFNPQERIDLLSQAEQLLIKDQPIMPIYNYVSKRVIKPYIGGVGTNVMDHHYSKDWFILKHKTISIDKQ